MTVQRTSSEHETLAFGRAFAGSLHPGDVVALYGTLGSGKTKFIAGVCEGLGVAMKATSPTFTLINEYPARFGLVVHIDLYRVGSKLELAELGVEEYFNDRCICLIEWAELVRELLPRRHFEIRLAHGDGEADRDISISRPDGTPV